MKPQDKLEIMKKALQGIVQKGRPDFARSESNWIGCCIQSQETARKALENCGESPVNDPNQQRLDFN